MTNVFSQDSLGRRRLLTRIIVAVQAGLWGTLASVLARAGLGPSWQTSEEQWLRAGTLDAMSLGKPLTVTLRVPRRDGYAQTIDRTVVFLVRGEGDQVRALHSTCTHLGCQTSFDPDLGRFVCPCHGGQYDLEGNVVAGPPPVGLPRLETRIDGKTVMVRV